MIENNQNEGIFMYKTILILMGLAVYSFSQTAIPLPPAHPNAKLNGGAINIGDFDGDLSDDLYCSFYEQSGAVITWSFGIYSMTKNQYLLLQSTNNSVSQPSAIGHFDGDKPIDIVVENIIYKYNSTLTKKKI